MSKDSILDRCRKDNANLKEELDKAKDTSANQFANIEILKASIEEHKQETIKTIQNLNELKLQFQELQSLSIKYEKDVKRLELENEKLKIDLSRALGYIDRVTENEPLPESVVKMTEQAPEKRGPKINNLSNSEKRNKIIDFLENLIPEK